MENDTKAGLVGTGLSSAPAENNKYLLKNFKDADTSPSQEVVFYKLNPDGTYENGTTLEEVLKVCWQRLMDLDNRFPCEENKHALIAIEEARKWLEVRTENRKARGVEGKHVA